MCRALELAIMTTHRPGPRTTLAFFLLTALTSVAACTGTIRRGPGDGDTSGTGGTGGATCPADEPSVGTPCAAGLSCTYPSCVSGAEDNIWCSGGMWTTDGVGLPCSCSSYSTSSDCASAGCRWLVPGCYATAFTPGCFDPTDCTLGASCPSGQTCTAVDADPCWDSNCDTCSGLAANICTGPG
jgi:hypothetical protein